MKHLVFALCLFLAHPGAGTTQTRVIELTRDNPATLIGTNSRDYSIFGLRLGMARAEAEKVLNNSPNLMGVQDDYNRSRIYVYSREPSGRPGKALLYLIWEPDVKRLGRITIFQDFRGHLTPNLRRLLDADAVDEQSAFRKEFIGASERSAVTLDIASIGLKHVTYYYDRIGLEVTHKRSSDGQEVVFAITEKSP